jgi:hypothetical protein
MKIFAGDVKAANKDWVRYVQNTMVHSVDDVQKIEELEKALGEKQREFQLVGEVVGSVDTFDMMISDLASSSVNIPLRWSLGKCIGGGACGSVYTGMILL